jgi:phage terminase large subunit-like protein
VGFVADIYAGGIGMDHRQAEVFALDPARHLSPLLAIHLVPIALHGAAGCWLGLLR